MKKILLQVPSIHLGNNRIFEHHDVNNTTEPWRVLREKLRMSGYELLTTDDNSLDGCDRILFLDTLSFDGTYIQREGIRAWLRRMFGLKTPRPWPNRSLYKEALQAGVQDKLVFILWENKAVNPHNYDPKVWGKFKCILTWDDDLVDNKKFFKFYLPVPYKNPPEYIPSFSEKKLLINMSTNKRSNHPNELYTARKKTIEYFTDSYPDDFDLYGYSYRPLNRVEKIFPQLIKKYKTNRGEVDNKIETLSKYKFTVCYENMQKVNGYVTEKILDAFVAKSVPIYWGAENINQYVDSDAFIDRRKFKNDAELADYLFSVTEERYNEYLTAGQRYLQSEKFKKFLPENFSKTIIETLRIK